MSKDKPVDLFNQPKVEKVKKVKVPKEKKSADRDPNVTLNEGQEKVLVLLKDFVKDHTKTDFCVKGAGGTGKTFVIQELFKRKKQNSSEYFVPNTVIGVCVTHQARINLMKSIPNTTTYASAANLMIMYDPMGTMYFTEKSGGMHFSELKGYKYIIFDECSMVDKTMMKTIRGCCNKDAKIIWMGDPSQLPPINADGNHDSPTFDIVDQFELTEKMRQDDDDHIAILGDIVREHIKTDHDLLFLNTLTQQYDIEKKKGYSISTINNVIASFVSNFNNGVDVRITAYRKKRIDMLNQMIRMNIWNDKAHDVYVPGELIIMNEQYGRFTEILAYNGQSFRIESLYVQMVEFVECHMIVVPKPNRKKGTKEIITLQVPTEKGLIAYTRNLSDLKKQALKQRDWSAYQAFKSDFANISYGYAINNYKIQGSTFKGCYVDLGDILGVKPISDKRKLQAFYVGISRPTDFLAIF